MQELAEDLGGTLKIDSDTGKGTRIEAYLPLVLPAELTATPATGLAASEPSPLAADFVGRDSSTGAYPTRAEEVG
jgi:hypothetical protein